MCQDMLKQHRLVILALPLQQLVWPLQLLNMQLLTQEHGVQTT
jgi:hypothetical protein